MEKDNPQNFRIGHGIDYHNLIYKKNNQQKLGGVEFLLDYKVLAHSDGDVIIHSISNAILGALNCGDIGEWFSDKDDQNKNLDSLKILDFVNKKCHDLNFKIINIDLTVVTDCIYMQDKKIEIKNFLQKYLSTFVNVKATRFESNNDKKIKCYSICLLSKF